MTAVFPLYIKALPYSFTQVLSGTVYGIMLSITDEILQKTRYSIGCDSAGFVL